MAPPLLSPAQLSCTSALAPTTPAIHVERLQPIEPTGLPLVVLVHGGSHTGDCYRQTPDGQPGWADYFAARGFPVAVVDWPGIGRSEPVALERLTGELICTVLAEFLDQCAAPVILLTHSMSGPYGWRLLETRSAHIAALVAIAPGPPGNLQPVAEIVDRDDDALIITRGDLRTSVPLRQAWIPDDAFVTEKLVGGSQRFPHAILAAYAKSLQPLPPRLMHERLNVDGSQLQVRNTDGYDGKPILIVTGTEDRDHSRERDGEIADWLGTTGAAIDYWYLADYGINGNGHMLMLEDNSDEIAGLIVGWLLDKLSTDLRRDSGRRGSA